MAYVATGTAGNDTLNQGTDTGPGTIVGLAGDDCIFQGTGLATITGDSDPGEGIICVLFGGATPFDAETLESLYPSHDDYVAAVTDAADAAVEAGFVLAADRDEIVAAAEDADVPG